MPAIIDALFNKNQFIPTDGDVWGTETFSTEQKQADTAEDALKVQEKERSNQITTLSSVRTEPLESPPHHCE